MVIILMGVSGSGKTTVGTLLANELNIPFYDADDFHPPENVEKMRSGTPLNDGDRHPWLEILSRKIEEWNRTGGAVLACSALKNVYRTILRPANSKGVCFIYLKGPESLILDRMKKRKDHYMPPELLRSQYEDLEEPDDAFTVSIEISPEEIVGLILKELKEMRG